MMPKKIGKVGKHHGSHQVNRIYFSLFSMWDPLSSVVANEQVMQTLKKRHVTLMTAGFLN